GHSHPSRRSGIPPAARQERPMPADRARLLRGVALSAGGLVLLVGLVAAAPLVRQHWKPTPPGIPPDTESSPTGTLVAGQPDTLELSAQVTQGLGIQTEEVRPATQPRKLEFSGKLALDTNHLARVHARFGGEVVEIAQSPNGMR